MSVVDTTTAPVDEVFPRLTHDQARQLTDDINACTVDAALMVAAAWKGQAWKALGYKNWEQYADEELPMLGSNRANRHVLLVSLRNVGMSTRAIGAVTGLDHSTVSRHVSRAANAAPDDSAGVANATPEITGTDGKTYSATPSRTTRRESYSETTEYANTPEGGGDDGEPLDSDAGNPSDGADSHDVGRSEPEPPPALSGPEGVVPEPDGTTVAEMVTEIPQRWIDEPSILTNEHRKFAAFMDRRTIKGVDLNHEAEGLAPFCPPQLIDAAIANAEWNERRWNELANELRNLDRKPNLKAVR